MNVGENNFKSLNLKNMIILKGYNIYEGFSTNDAWELLSSLIFCLDEENGNFNQIYTEQFNIKYET